MHHVTIATGLALALAAMFATAPAKAEIGGPVMNDQGQCRSYGASNNLTFSYWGECPGTLMRHGHTHVIRSTLTHHALNAHRHHG
jgi:hypothetical protein